LNKGLAQYLLPVGLLDYFEIIKDETQNGNLNQESTFLFTTFNIGSLASLGLLYLILSVMDFLLII